MSRKRAALASVRYNAGTYKLYVANLLIAIEGSPMSAYYSPDKIWTWQNLSKAARKINKTAKEKYTQSKETVTQSKASKYVTLDYEITSREG